VQSDVVVVNAPAFSLYTQFFDGVEDFAIQKLVAQFAVERFAVAVLPGRAGRDLHCFCAGVGKPLTQVFSHELRAVDRTTTLWNSNNLTGTNYRTVHFLNGTHNVFASVLRRFAEVRDVRAVPASDGSVQKKPEVGERCGIRHVVGI
jgi:hypothetical protein